MTRGLFNAPDAAIGVAQNTKPVDGSVLGGGRGFGPVMTGLNPLLYIYFSIKDRERDGGGPLFPKH